MAPQRKLSVAALAQRNLRQLYPSIRTVAERMKIRWEKSAAGGDVLDVVEELKRFTVDVTMLVAFGQDANTVEQANDVIQRELEVIFPAIIAGYSQSFRVGVTFKCRPTDGSPAP